MSSVVPKTQPAPGHRDVAFCPLCGTPVKDVEAANCPRCGFSLDVVLVKTGKEIPQSEPSRVPLFTYTMLGVHGAAAGLLVALFLPSSLSMDPYGLARIIIYLQLGSVIVLALFSLLLRGRIALTAVRYGLFIFGLVTLPLGVAATAASLAVHPAIRYCQLCGRRIAWRVPYAECPNCHGVFHLRGRCIIERRERLAAKWGREPSGEEVESYCPLCFTRREEKGG